MLDFNKLQAVMGKLRFKDDSALKAMGLAKLAPLYDVYPLVEDGRKLYCLLQKGLQSASARALSPVAASRQVIVLQAQPTGILKIWPNPAADSVAAQEEQASEKVIEASPSDEIEFIEE